MANIAKAIKQDFLKIMNGEVLGEFYVDGLEHIAYDIGAVTGSYSSHPHTYHYPTGMAWVEAPVPVITKRTFLFCIYCGRKYLLKEENIKTPLLEMNCDCGGELEFKEEEDE